MIVLSHPEWWVEHVDEPVDALTIATQKPERDEPDDATDEEVVVSDPAWWLDHVNELLNALAQAEAARTRETDEPRRQ